MRTRRSPSVLPDPVRTSVASHLRRVGLKSFEATLLHGGGNNQVFRIDSGHASLLLKVYFRHSGDRRDRLSAEYQFTRFASNHGLTSIPRPIAMDAEHGFGLYEYIRGRMPNGSDVTLATVSKARDFYLTLNRYRRAPDARSLPIASEACFSLAEHIRCVDRRVARLGSIRPRSAADRAARDFCRDTLSPEWRALTQSLASNTTPREIRAVLPPADRRISPSDFGFHNAILSRSGQLRFIDFEYAGWDDPAKTVCDFFCQKKIPVPMRFFSTFCDGIVNHSSQPSLLRLRIVALLPIYRIKWCCILMNEFLPVGRARRTFSIPHTDLEQRKLRQLRLADRALSSLTLEMPS